MFAARPQNISSSSAGWIPFALTELKDLDAADGQYRAGVTFASTSYQTQGNQSVPWPPFGGKAYYNPSGSTPAIWIRCTVVSGDAPDNETGTWQHSSGNPSWHWTRVASGTTSAVVQFEVATDSGGSTVVLDTGNINLTVTVP